jgi:S-adenosylmethionine hydrolase
MDRMTPLVALVTDFGARDSYVAEVHLAIRRVVPSARVLDVAHDLPPFELPTAALVVERTLASLPPGAALVAVVDPGVGSARARIALRVRDRWCVGPDNGLLPVRAGAEVWRLDALRPRDGVTTFDGREVFGPAGALLAAGAHPKLLGLRHARPVTSALPDDADFESVGPLRYARGVIVALDRYSNALTSVRLPPGVGFDDAEVLEPEAFAGPLRASYAAAPKGRPVALVGSSGRVELGVSCGESGLRVGEEVLVRCRA